MARSNRRSASRLAAGPDARPCPEDKKSAATAGRATWLTIPSSRQQTESGWHSAAILPAGPAGSRLTTPGGTASRLTGPLSTNNAMLAPEPQDGALSRLRLPPSPGNNLGTLGIFGDWRQLDLCIFGDWRQFSATGDNFPATGDNWTSAFSATGDNWALEPLVHTISASVDARATPSPDTDRGRGQGPFPFRSGPCPLHLIAGPPGAAQDRRGLTSHSEYRHPGSGVPSASSTTGLSGISTPTSVSS